MASQVPDVSEKLSNILTRSRLQDQRTIYSATENTKLVMRPGPRPPERIESVASVALRHTGFPPPPKFIGGVFQCPCCRLEFRALEAEKARWSQHFMQDFEPYFCIFEDCKTPFDVPNSFNGLLGHLQEHLPPTWHADLPDGETKEFDDEALFTNYVMKHGGASGDALAIMKETSLRRTAFLFASCPFCGGYPDVLENKYPNPSQPDAQLALRRHIKEHMHEIALFLPPYRDDILEDCSDFCSSAVTRRRSINVNNASESSDQSITCDNENCDCKDWQENFPGPYFTPQEPPVDEDFWQSMFRDSALYDRSAGLDEGFIFDTCLKPFIARFLNTSGSFNAADDSITADIPESRVVSLEEEHNDTDFAPIEPIVHLLPAIFLRPASAPAPAMLPPEVYTIAWICKSEESYRAARKYLEEEHHSRYWENQKRSRAHFLGRIERHNVVVIQWKSQIPIRTKDIAEVFPNVQVKFVVDIAGGVPGTKHDIRLGDVVVSGGDDLEMRGLLLLETLHTNGKVITLLSASLERLLPSLDRAVLMSRRQLDALIRTLLNGDLEDEAYFGHPGPNSDVLYRPNTFQNHLIGHLEG
ncbi:hypothetical protein B0J13DRAFT_645877 [Dactylonectria estremocensis]|uniref:C2H2-type domain-containing protein n=1 Tax=Dactylonectria estremocensis TaxID=1079267 RepID=A0A9P9DWY6_9HYPO|nr:hypothetical protein B0J13DRAFT_645877 [Dactylonectria estremocensis]